MRKNYTDELNPSTAKKKTYYYMGFLITNHTNSTQLKTKVLKEKNIHQYMIFNQQNCPSKVK
jgi:hypothetical protein